MRRSLPLVLIVFVASACGGNNTPNPPSNGQDSSGELKVTGRERLGWNQEATSTAELNSFGYAIYLDGVRSELRASCGSSRGSDGYACTAPLPRMSVGSHTIELATYIDAGGIYESARSRPLRLSLAALTSTPVTVSEQVQLDLQLIVDGLSQPSDMAFAPDGAIFIAERQGLVRVVRDGRVMPEPALDLSADVPSPEGGLLSVALDRRFDENQLAYVLYTSGFSSRDLTFMLARFRSVGDRFAERAVLLDRVPASPRGPGGTVRMGSDGNLYIGLDDSGNGRVAPSLGSYNGKILRMTPQATTPDDQAGATPVYSVDHPLPKAVDWQPSSGELWVVDGLQNASARLSAFVAENARQKRATMRARYDLPAGTGASSAAFYRTNVIPIFRDNLFIAAETGRHLIRVRFDPQNPERVVSVERLLQDQIGALRVVAEGLDGGLYLCNQTQLWRLVL
jgi:glucose/arabinose dehydrogenase